jgi:hypothetical protein
VALALVAVASTGAANWNHGTVGPSRYGLWLLPFLFVLLAESCGGPPTHSPDFRELKARHGPDAWAYLSWCVPKQRLDAQMPSWYV